LAWGHFIEGGGFHPHQQAKGVTSMMDNDNDSQVELGEGIPLALDEFVEEQNSTVVEHRVGVYASTDKVVSHSTDLEQ